MMIHNVRVPASKKIFLLKLKEDVKTIKNTKEWLINADKLSNIYKIENDTCTKSLMESITKTYKKSNRNKINIEAKKSLKLMTGSNNNASIMC